MDSIALNSAAFVPSQPKAEIANSSGLGHEKQKTELLTGTPRAWLPQEFGMRLPPSLAELRLKYNPAAQPITAGKVEIEQQEIVANSKNYAHNLETGQADVKETPLATQNTDAPILEKVCLWLKTEQIFKFGTLCL